MKKSLYVPGTVLAVLVCCCCGGAEGTVNAAWLNARVFPELKAPVAVKLPRNKKVEITKLHGPWLEIVAPDTTPVFASAAYLDGNRALRDINLRIKPAANAAVIGRARKGDTVKPVSVPDRFGWIHLAPLPEMRLYVYKEYVTYDAAQVPAAKTAPAPDPAPEKKTDAPQEKKTEVPAKPAPAPAPAPEKKTEKAPVKPAPAPAPGPAPEKKAEKAPAKPAPAPAPAPEKKAAKAPAKRAPAPAPAPEKKAAKAPAKKGFQLSAAHKAQLVSLGVDLKKQEKYQQNGMLVSVTQPTGECTAYALTDVVSSRSLGFVFAEPPIQLKTMVNKTVAVKGIAFRIPSWRNPVVAVESITVVGE